VLPRHVLGRIYLLAAIYALEAVLVIGGFHIVSAFHPGLVPVATVSLAVFLGLGYPWLRAVALAAIWLVSRLRFASMRWPPLTELTSDFSMPPLSPSLQPIY
jgi:hypothetical protein